MNSKELFLMLFVIILLFSIKKVKNIYDSRKKLTGEATIFELRGRKMLFIMSLFLIGFGTVYAVQIRNFESIVYVVIGIVYAIIAKDRLYVTDTEICYDGKYIEFKNIKKWTNVGSKFLEIVHSTPTKEATAMIPLDAKTIEEVASKIKNKKNHKIKKGSK